MEYQVTVHSIFPISLNYFYFYFFSPAYFILEVYLIYFIHKQSEGSCNMPGISKLAIQIHCNS